MNLEELLTPCVLAYWFMDDGSIKSKQSKGVIFNTHCFPLDQVEILCQILQNKFLLKCWPHKQIHKNKIYWQIYVSGKSYEIFKDLILPYIIPEMLYKFPPERQVRPKKYNNDGSGAQVIKDKNIAMEA